MIVKLSDGMECQILLETGASKSFMSKSHYLWCKSLHSLPKFASETQRIEVGNGHYASVLFIIPVVIDIHDHKFEIFKLVSKIHKNVDFIVGIKNIFELEGIIDSWESCFSFLKGQYHSFLKNRFIETERTMFYKNRSIFHRWNLRVSNS